MLTVLSIAMMQCDNPSSMRPSKGQGLDKIHISTWAQNIIFKSMGQYFELFFKYILIEIFIVLSSAMMQCDNPSSMRLSKGQGLDKIHIFTWAQNIIFESMGQYFKLFFYYIFIEIVILLSPAMMQYDNPSSMRLSTGQGLDKIHIFTWAQNIIFKSMGQYF